MVLTDEVQETRLGILWYVVGEVDAIRRRAAANSCPDKREQEE